MKQSVAIIDYGLGNLRSVEQAVRYCGAMPVITSSPDELQSMDYAILPGVGAFRCAVEQLQSLQLFDAIQSYADSGKPLLGICLGMQLLLERADEFGHAEGLGIIAGDVIKMPLAEPAKLPHIGWNRLLKPDHVASWQETLLQDCSDAKSYAYFVHSFVACPRDSQSTLAEFYYAGARFPAVIRSGRVVGCQFHPEKSGLQGLTVLQHFLEGVS